MGDYTAPQAALRGPVATGMLQQQQQQQQQELLQRKEKKKRKKEKRKDKGKDEDKGKGKKGRDKGKGKKGKGEQEAAVAAPAVGDPELGPSARPRRLDPAVLQYVSSVEDSLLSAMRVLCGEVEEEQEGGEEEAQESREEAWLLVRSVLRELRYHTASLMVHREGSRIMEDVLLKCDAGVLALLLGRVVEGGYARAVALDRFGSHALQVVLGRVASLVPEEGVEEESGSEDRGRNPLNMSYAAVHADGRGSGERGRETHEEEEEEEKQEQDQEEGEEGEAESAMQISLHNAVLKFAEAVIGGGPAALLEMLTSTAGSHVMKDLFCVLAGSPIVGEKKGRQARHTHWTVDPRTSNLRIVPFDALVSETGGMRHELMRAVPHEWSACLLSNCISSLLGTGGGDGSCSAEELQDATMSYEGATTLAVLSRVFVSFPSDAASTAERAARAAVQLACKIFDIPADYEQQSQPDGNGETSAKEAPLVYAMSGEKQCSHYVQAAVETASDALFDFLFTACFRDRLQEYAQHGTANFVLQSVIRRARDPLKLEVLAAVLASPDSLIDVVRHHHWGVLHCLLNQLCTGLAAADDAGAPAEVADSIRSVGAAVAWNTVDTVCRNFLDTGLTMDRETMLRQEQPGTPLEDLQPPPSDIVSALLNVQMPQSTAAHEGNGSGRAPVAYAGYEHTGVATHGTPGGVRIDVNGAKIFSQLVGTRLLNPLTDACIEGFLSLPADQTVALCVDPKASRVVVESVIFAIAATADCRSGSSAAAGDDNDDADDDDGEGASMENARKSKKNKKPKFKRTFEQRAASRWFSRLLDTVGDAFEELCTHRIGWHCVRHLFEQGDKACKARLVQMFTEHQTGSRLMSVSSGRNLSKIMQVDLYRREPEAWTTRIKRAQEAEALFADILDPFEKQKAPPPPQQHRGPQRARKRTRQEAALGTQRNGGGEEEAVGEDNGEHDVGGEGAKKERKKQRKLAKKARRAARTEKPSEREGSNEKAGDKFARQKQLRAEKRARKAAAAASRMSTLSSDAMLSAREMQDAVIAPLMQEHGIA